MQWGNFICFRWVSYLNSEGSSTNTVSGFQEHRIQAALHQQLGGTQTCELGMKNADL